MMKNMLLSGVLLFAAIAVSNGQGEGDSRAALQEKIAQLQAQLVPLEQIRKDRDAAFENISVVNPADLVTINAKYKAAQAQYAPIEQKLSALQATLHLLDTAPNPNLATEKQALQKKPIPLSGSDDPDRLLGDDPGVQNPPPRHNPRSPSSADDADLTLDGDDLELNPGSGRSSSRDARSGDTGSRDHLGNSQNSDGPGHSRSGHRDPAHSGARDPGRHSGTGHSGSDHRGPGSGHSGHSAPDSHSRPAHSGAGHGPSHSAQPARGHSPASVHSTPGHP